MISILLLVPYQELNVTSNLNLTSNLILYERKGGKNERKKNLSPFYYWILIQQNFLVLSMALK